MKKNLKILILEDAPADAALIDRTLRRHGISSHATRVETREDYLRELERNPPDLILSDHGLPAFDGFSALAIARDRRPDIPFIFVAGSLDGKLAVDSLKNGAADFVLKTQLTALAPAVQRALRVAGKRAQQKQAKRKAGCQALAELCPDPLLVLNEGRILSANTAARRLLGATGPGELIGKPAGDLLPAGRQEDFNRRLQESVPPGADAKSAPQNPPAGWPPSGFSEETLVRRDGHPVEVQVAAMRFGEGAVQLMVRDITGEKGVAATRRAREALTTAILQTSPDAIIRIDRAGRVHEWNRAAERIFGHQQPDAVGRTLDELIMPAALSECHLAALADYLTTGTGSLSGGPIELAGQRADGGKFPVELAITRDPAGADPPMFTVFVRDLTGRKETEEAQRRNELRKTAAVENSPDAIVAIDQDGVINGWNPAAEKIFGYSEAFARGRNVAELIVPPASVNAHRQGLARFLRTGSGRLIGHRVELTAIRANGVEFPVEIAITQVPGDGPPAFIGYIRDITGCRQAEEALQKSEARCRLLVESVEDYAIYLLDPGGRVTIWNAGAERLTGYRAAEALGRRFNRFFTPEDKAREKPEQALAVATTEGRFQEEGWRMRKDGSRYWAAVVLVALRDYAGKLQGFSAISRDITKPREAEETARRHCAELELRVEERTAELRTAREEREAFASSVSHELRASLFHLSGFAELLQNRAGPQEDETGRHYLKAICQAVVHMGKMIDDLLAFSRMSCAEMRALPVGLAPLVTGALHDLRAVTQDRKIAWTIQDLPDVSGDPALLRQVIFNLIANAVKYTRTRAEARIEIGSASNEHETVVFVRDNGVGFDVRDADKLYGVFQRLHAAAEFEGAGIGLASVRRIIQRHGGRTWAEGVVDGGATFYFSLPRGEHAAHGAN